MAENIDLNRQSEEWPGLLLEPMYDFDRYSSIVLGRANAQMRVDAETIESEGEAVLYLRPNPRLVINARGKSGQSWPSVRRKIQKISECTIGGQPLKGSVRDLIKDKNGEFRLTWIPEDEPVVSRGDDQSQFNHLVFHLFNFRGFRPNRLGTLRTEIATNNLHDSKLDQRNLRLCLSSTAGLRISERLRQDRSCTLTHVASLSFCDGGTMSGATARSLMSMADDMFSFANGFRCPPVCTVGLDEKGVGVWIAWSAPQEYRRIAASWYDGKEVNELHELFGAFVEGTRKYRKTLNQAIKFYLEANLVGKDLRVRIILIISGLESIASLLIEQVNPGEDATEQLSPQQLLRALFSSMGIGDDCVKHLAVAGELPHQTRASGVSCPITELLLCARDSVLKPNEITMSAHFYEEVARLGLWALELAILYCCSYKGTYRNRTKNQMAGERRSVPWLKRETLDNAF